ncbi:predicted protein [Cyanophage PSS2]|uniref:hypothetical protein n=1 Tax=Cyanophage PSS2 TaxID=658401 RepID=UPI0001B04047|nr:hypothetical protein PSS2_gp112 [Cyanophage PSS2]ACT65674.1 hypothetical protein [Cyanophage PSS2]ACY75814.1 predicted protein [Cyanophage PSS2]
MSAPNTARLVDEMLKEIQWRVYRLQVNAPDDFRLASINAKCKELEKRIAQERRLNRIKVSL